MLWLALRISVELNFTHIIKLSCESLKIFGKGKNILYSFHGHSKNIANKKIVI